MGILDGWRFCPRCAAPTEPGVGNVTCPSCGFVAWANSIPAVQGLVEREGKLLLARRAIEPHRGTWDLPGGFLEEGEHPRDGLRRELKEEAGLDVEVGDFVEAWLDPYDGRVVLGLTYDATPVGGDERAADDVGELRWFAPDELPPADEFGFRSHPHVLSLWRARHQHP